MLLCNGPFAAIGYTLSESKLPTGTSKTKRPHPAKFKFSVLPKCTLLIKHVCDSSSEYVYQMVITKGSLVCRPGRSVKEDS